MAKWWKTYSKYVYGVAAIAAAYVGGNHDVLGMLFSWLGQYVQ